MRGLLPLLIYAALFYLMMRFGCGANMVHGRGGHEGNGGSGADAGPSGDPWIFTGYFVWMHTTRLASRETREGVCAPPLSKDSTAAETA